ncbi:hypothetical protein PybrP1_007612, partial [[Pythium] brassicae (nom. inval.)]
LAGAKFQILRCGEPDGADPVEFELLAAPNNAAIGREHTSSAFSTAGSETRGSGSVGGAISQDTAEISKQQVAAFVARASGEATGAVALLAKYLDQCGEWAHTKLVTGGDDSDMHAICFWAEKLITNGSEERDGAPQHSQGVAMVAANAGPRRLSTRAKLFLLELKFDRLVRQTVFGKQRRKQLNQLSQLIASADGLLLALCWEEEDEEGEAESELVRLFWLLARMHERCGRSGVAKEYYVKCQETLTALIARQRGSVATAAAASVSEAICLPNQKVDAEISLAVLSDRISGLESTDVRSEARRCFAAETFDQVVDLLLEHFFPDKHPPRIVDLLQEFEVAENTPASDERRLIDTLLEAFAKSPRHNSDDTQLFLITQLFHVTKFVEGLGGADEISTGALHPEQILESGLSAAKFILGQLEATTASSKYRPLLQACCLSCLKPSLLLLFDSPSDVFRSVCAVLGGGDASPSSTEVTLHTIRAFDEAAFRELFAKLPAPVNKKRQSRRDRVRALLVELLRFLNRHLRASASSSGCRSLAADKRSVLMLHCRALMKEEEDTLSRREDKTARQLFGNAAVLFLLLRAAAVEEEEAGDRVVLSDLVALLHSRMGQYGICGLSYFGDAGSDAADASCCFLETSIWVLSQFTDASARETASPGGGDSAESDSPFNRELAQCYHCLYDVQLLPGCEDHKTGNSFVLLLRDAPTKRPRALRLAHFAVPILLSRPPKTNGQKKENLKLLGALREALAETHSMDHARRRGCPHELQAFVSPSRLLEWGSNRFPPIVTEATAGDAPLDHLWYLLGENFILSRVRRRGNAGELTEFEARAKERMAFLLTDVLYYRPDRIKSWIRLGKTMKELYHTASDAWAVVLGRKRKVAALRAFAALEAKAADEGGFGVQKLSFDTVVVRTQLFEHMKRWEEREKATRDEYRVVIARGDDAAAVDASTSESSLSMEAFTLQYIVQVIEFARRCFDMAAHLAEASLRRKEAATERMGDMNDRDDRNDSQDDLDEVRATVIECNEESGLLLYNVLQEFSVLSGAHEAPFPDATFLRVAAKALSYFRTGLAVCDEMEDADEVRFRLNFMCGKTLKKQLRCQQRLPTRTTPPQPSASEAPVAPRAILECFARAEKAHEDGEMEHALVHAFYALQAVRMEVVLQPQVSVADLRLVCEHYFEEEEEGDEDDDNDDDSGGDESAEESGAASGNDTGDESVDVHSTDEDDGGTTRRKTQQQNKKAEDPLKVTKDDVFKLLDRAEATRNDESKLAYHTARGWLYLNVVDALESVPNEDRYFHPSRYVLAQAVYRASEFLHRVLATSADPHVTALAAALGERTRPLGDASAAAATAASERAAKALLPLFDKKRPQVVAIWLSEHIPAAKKFEELNQRQMKYDRYRLKYWGLYMQLLEECGAYGRLKEVGTWVLACKEEHDVIDEMLGLVLRARGNVLRARVGAFRVADELPAERGSVNSATPIPTPTLRGDNDSDSGGLHGASGAASGAQSVALLKLLAKTYSYYLDVVDAQPRLASALSAFDEVLSGGEVMLSFLYLAGAVAFPAEFGGGANAALPGVAVEFVQAASESICTFLLEGAAASRVIAELGAQWKPLVDATRTLCEDKWPERSGKGKLAKSRQRAKAPAPAVAPATVTATVSLAQTGANPSDVDEQTASPSAGSRRVEHVRSAAIVRQDTGFFDASRTGKLANRLSADTAVVGKVLSDNVSDGLFSVSQGVGSVAMFFVITRSSQS